MAAEDIGLWTKIKVLIGLNSAYNDAVSKAKQDLKEKHMTAKSIFSSKTFWFNLIGSAVQVADSVGAWNLIPQPWGVAAQGIVNIILRAITVEPVTAPLLPIPPK